MRERVQCEFSLIRYVPDVVKGEFTNIGVVLREAGRDGTAVVRFTRDWSRVRCMDAEADIGLLESLESEIEARLRLGAADTKPVMQTLEDTLSNSVQITESRACLAESVPAELEQLMRMYVEPLKVKVERKRTGRAAIAGAMRTEFERAGVWVIRCGLIAGIALWLVKMGWYGCFRLCRWRGMWRRRRGWLTRRGSCGMECCGWRARGWS
jgi:Protein of unknown function (DUF3037)